MAPFDPVPGTHLGHRFMWLVVVPTGFTFGPWVLTYFPDRSGTTTLVAVAFLPLAGVVPVLIYRWLSPERVLLLPYLPYALAAAVFAATMLDLIAAMAQEPYGDFMPVVQFAIGFFQPGLVVVGGIYSFVAISEGKWH